ncbi:MAG: 5-(carboxyamino)imidazole ribonucleotide mutase [Clostridiales Family XIII bacterium]|jgi:5-(carboxyamino)imidazole ribonucleotide mutase|nr:5-(carboxyamino)imidazole ribonucleotide mutase [Clostridiales Family XIII bacterium]
MPKIAILMGSKSDLPIVERAEAVLREFGVECETRIVSAHRTPLAAAEFASGAEERGIEAIIAAAGKAAHLAGVVAAHTALPVIGLPIGSPTFCGLDALLSVVQMPKGVPVATVAVDGAENAGLLAVQILSLRYGGLRQRMKDYKEAMAKETARLDEELQAGRAPQDR